MDLDAAAVFFCLVVSPFSYFEMYRSVKKRPNDTYLSDDDRLLHDVCCGGTEEA